MVKVLIPIIIFGFLSFISFLYIGTCILIVRELKKRLNKIITKERKTSNYDRIVPEFKL